MIGLQLNGEGQRLEIRGDMTINEVPRLLADLPAYPGVTQVNLAGVTRVDSSALSVLLALSRAAAGATITVHHAPPALRSLSDLYGLQSLFWVA